LDACLEGRHHDQEEIAQLIVCLISRKDISPAYSQASTDSSATVEKQMR
jgi:hypothetical protein